MDSDWVILKSSPVEVRALSVPALSTPVARIFSYDGILCDQIGPGCQIKNIFIAGISEMQQ